jgi:hypothetical protein
MSRRADILIRARSGRPLALVEVKNLPHLSEGKAVDLRDALVQHLADPVQYIVVASQSAAFIWELKGQRFGTTPDYGKAQFLDMNPVFREYLTDAELTRHIRGAELDLVLSHWLGDLARGRTEVLPRIQEQGPLTSFVSDIRDAQINLEALT